MFVLAELQYIIRVEPRRFGKDMKREVRDELNRKFANKVAHTSLLTHLSVSFTQLYVSGAAQCWTLYSSV